VRVQLLPIHNYSTVYHVEQYVYTVEQKRKPYCAVVASAVKPKGLECEPDTPCGQRGDGVEGITPPPPAPYTLPSIASTCAKQVHCFSNAQHRPKKYHSLLMAGTITKVTVV
jgi:hypothetical protein